MLTQELPLELLAYRENALKALGLVTPAGSPRTDAEAKSFMISSRTEAGRGLPAYYLVYFLLVDLLKFPHRGPHEKSAWAVPVRINGRLYSIEHAKFGIGIFAPTLTEGTTRSEKPSTQAESDAQEIVFFIHRAVRAAKPYFEWRAKNAVKGADLNVKNRSNELFRRYCYFRDQYFLIKTAYKNSQKQRQTKQNAQSNGAVGPLGERLSIISDNSIMPKEAAWCGQAAVDAFFSWTEHVFIHLGILQQHIKTGEKVAMLAGSEWKDKFNAALDINNSITKKHYDALVQLRVQVRNFMAHGAFGKQGEAFEFHSGAGAVPVLLTGQQRQRFTLIGKAGFVEEEAISAIDEFIEHLWSEDRSPAKLYIEADIPTILSYASDGTYERAMLSESDMKDFLRHLLYRFDQAANMDW